MNDFLTLGREEKNPNIEWNKSWENIRKRNLNPDNVSFLLKLTWGVLPTELRLARITNSSENCKFCWDRRKLAIIGDNMHFFVHCPENLEITSKLITNLTNIR